MKRPFGILPTFFAIISFQKYFVPPDCSRPECSSGKRIQIIISDFYFLVIRFSHNLYFISSSSLRMFVCLTFVYIFNKLDRLDVSMRHISAKYINAPIKIVCEKVRSFHLKRFTIFKANNSHTIYVEVGKIELMEERIKRLCAASVAAYIILNYSFRAVHFFD